MPSGDSHSAGPMPERCSTCTEPIAPAHMITSPLARASMVSPFWREAHADGAAVLDDEALDQHVGFQPQVRPVQHGLEEAARRRPAPAALLVDVEIAHALIVAGVEVGDFPDAHVLRGFADRIEDGPGQPRRLDAPAAAGAMMLALAEEMILQPPEYRQHVVIAPAGEPKLAPMIVIGGLSAHRDHGVDGRAAADHLASGDRRAHGR